MLWRCAFWLISLLPLSWLHGLGHGLSRLLLRLPNRQRQLAEHNLAQCLPELTAAQRQRLLAQALSHFARAALESPALWRASEARITRWIRSVHGAELVTQALAEGRGAILFTPHLGSWEMVGLDSSRRWPITHLYKAQKGAVDGLIHAGRSRFGARLAASDSGGVRKLLAALKRGEAIGILPDQDPPPGSGEFAGFFGHLAHTPVLPVKLAARPGVALFFCWAERLPAGQGFSIHYETAPEAIGNPDPQVALRALNHGVELLVRRMPEQYWWGYPRFRRRPDGESPFYPAR